MKYVQTLFAVAFVLCFFACGNSRQSSLVVELDSVRTGDLMFRMGRGGESLVVKAMSGGDYSHVGIALQTDSGWMVVHAVPGEADESSGGKEVLKCEPILDYYQSQRAVDGCVARVKCPDDQARRAADYAVKKVRQGVLFDNSYNTWDSTAIYCTELVWRAYGSVGIDLLEGRPTDRFIFPSDVLDSQWVEWTRSWKKMK